MTDWEKTDLWLSLKATSDPEAVQVRALLLLRMPGIQHVLASGGTSPTDFTLHDAGHSFRVAQWMAKIVPPRVLEKLGSYELALLLLAAYLHDIGMTPEQRRVHRHWRYLLFGQAERDSEDALSAHETADFQLWLTGRSVNPPLAADGKASEEQLRHAAHLLTHYARDQHNDWSEEWIRANLSTDHLGSYERWVDDLVQLCRSHHEGYKELVADSFDPRPAGRQGQVVHHRYLACVLRIADILDVDPERTPDVIFQHRLINPGSLPYWSKDHDLRIEPDGTTLVVYARPRSRSVEVAIENTIEDIRKELELCARLKRERPFSNYFLRVNDPLPHAWSFPESVLPKIERPRDFIDDQALPPPESQKPPLTVKREEEEAALPKRVPHKLRLVGIVLSILLLVTLGAAALRMSQPDQNEQLELSVEVHDPAGKLLPDVEPECSPCGRARLLPEGMWKFTFRRGLLPVDGTVTITAKDLIGFASGRKKAYFRRQHSLSMRLDLLRDHALPPKRERFKLEPQLSWLTSATWTPEGRGLILVGKTFASDRSTSAYLYSLQGQRVVAIDGSIKNPASILANGREYILYTRSEKSLFVSLDSRYHPIHQHGISVSSAQNENIHLDGVKEWSIAGGDIAAIGDISQGDPADQPNLLWMNWLIRFSLTEPEKFGQVKEIVRDRALPHIYRMAYPHLAALGKTAYFLDTHGEKPTILPFGEESWRWPGNAIPLPFQSFHTLIDASKTSETYSLFESSRAVAAVYGWKSHLYLLLKCATQNGNLTRWFLTKMAPQEMTPMYTISLPATSPHVSLAPGYTMWAVIEKDKFVGREEQTVSHLTLVPAVEIESADSPLVFRGSQPQCTNDAWWNEKELRWSQIRPGS